MNYNLRLAEIRKENNLSQKQLAKEIGLSRQTYGHYEVQENIIPLKHLNSIANYFNVSIDYLFNFTDVRNYKNSIHEINLSISGEKLKAFRKEQKLTQVKLADVLNTFHTVIVDYEHGKNIIATPFLYTICKKYKVSADYLLGKVDEPKYLK